MPFTYCYNPPQYNQYYNMAMSGDMHEWKAQHASTASPLKHCLHHVKKDPAYDGSEEPHQLVQDQKISNAKNYSHIYICTFIRIHTYIHAYIYIHIHIYIYAYTHTTRQQDQHHLCISASLPSPAIIRINMYILEHWYCNIIILHHGNDIFEQCTCNTSMYGHNDILEHWHV